MVKRNFHREKQIDPNLQRLKLLISPQENIKILRLILSCNGFFFFCPSRQQLIARTKFKKHNYFFVFSLFPRFNDIRCSKVPDI